jgi:hypothetical protein
LSFKSGTLAQMNANLDDLKPQTDDLGAVFGKSV